MTELKSLETAHKFAFDLYTTLVINQKNIYLELQYKIVARIAFCCTHLHADVDLESSENA